MSLLKRATLVQKLILSYAAMTIFTVAALEAVARLEADRPT